MTTGQRMKARRKEIGLSAERIAEILDVHPATIYRYENGEIEKVPGDRLEVIANALQTTPQYLMGWADSQRSLPSNVRILEPMNKIPLVGRIACGAPILAEENIEDYVDLPRHIRADFALTCKGESMINAGIRSGDVVYIRKQERVENGQIAAVRVGDDEATLKRFYFDGDSIRLVPENPSCRTKSFFGQDMEQVHVVGLAVGYTHAIEK